MLTLVVTHNIGLTKEERYKLSQGELVEVTGISVPVWFDKGNTSEPANEVFVSYKLTNQLEPYPIKTTKTGYEINMPQRNLNAEEEIKKIPEAILQVLGINKAFPSAKNLVDVKDGGTEFLQFRQFSRSHLIVDGEKTQTPLSIIHCVEIKPIEDLTDSMN
jgi:hypothetical protein